MQQRIRMQNANANKAEADTAPSWRWQTTARRRGHGLYVLVVSWRWCPYKLRCLQCHTVKIWMFIKYNFWTLEAREHRFSVAKILLWWCKEWFSIIDSLLGWFTCKLLLYPGEAFLWLLCLPVKHRAANSDSRSFSFCHFIWCPSIHSWQTAAKAIHLYWLEGRA